MITINDWFKELKTLNDLFDERKTTIRVLSAYNPDLSCLYAPTVKKLYLSVNRFLRNETGEISYAAEALLKQAGYMISTDGRVVNIKGPKFTLVI